jgi:hypothetical protein
MLEVLIHAVQVERVVLHVVGGLLLLLVKMVLGVVWMMCNGMVVNVRVVLGMVVVILHAFRRWWFPSTHHNHITTTAIVLVDVFLRRGRLSAAWRPTATKHVSVMHIMQHKDLNST